MRWLVVALVLVRIAHADPDPSTALLARTGAVAKEVAKVRGLPLKHTIPNELVDRAELRTRLTKLASDHKTAAQTAVEGLAFARWGMIPLDTDYTQLVIDLMSDQIAGYYDPDTKKLTILQGATDDPDWAEMVLAHEIDHGLQDQSFDLSKFEDLPDSEGDAALARHALVEGDGIALMLEVVLARNHVPAPWGDPTVAAELVTAMSLPTGDSLDRAPLAIKEAMLFPYRAGFSFVAALRRRQPWSAVDAVFHRPPRSTEQIMHVDKYVADERPVGVVATVPTSLAGYAIAHTTVWGELGFQLFLRSHGVAEQAAAEAAAGWAGDRVAVLAKPGETRADRTVGLARLEWDSEVDAIEAQDAAVRAIDNAVAGTTIEHTSLRTRWVALDGTSAFVERRGSSLVIALGVPAWAAEPCIAEAWTATKRQANK